MHFTKRYSAGIRKLFPAIPRIGVRPHPYNPRPMATTPQRREVSDVVRRSLPTGAGAFLSPRLRRDGRPPCDWDVALLAPAGGDPLAGAVVQRVRNGLDNLRTLHSFHVVDAARLSPVRARELRETATTLA